ncbi:MAG: AsmA family protein [Verrucomicrobiota bacterium]
MRFLVRWTFRCVLLSIVLFVALVLLKDTLVKSLVERRIRSQTGLEVRIGKFEASLLTPTVTIENFKLYNAPEFGGSMFIDLPELHLEYDLTPMTSGQIHLRLLRLNLTEINLVENKDGKTNLELLQHRLEESPQWSPDQKNKRKIEFAGIDTLNLTIGKVNYISFKEPGKNWSRNLGLKNEVVKNVKSEADLAAVVLKSLVQTWYSGRGVIAPPAPEKPANPPNPRPKNSPAPSVK